jgi:hypothetical protein
MSVSYRGPLSQRTRLSQPPSFDDQQPVARVATHSQWVRAWKPFSMCECTSLLPVRSRAPRRAFQVRPSGTHKRWSTSPTSRAQLHSCGRGTRPAAASARMVRAKGAKARYAVTQKQGASMRAAVTARGVGTFCDGPLKFRFAAPHWGPDRREQASARRLSSTGYSDRQRHRPPFVRPRFRIATAAPHGLTTLASPVTGRAAGLAFPGSAPLALSPSWR